jgi:cytochrome P450
VPEKLPDDLELATLLESLPLLNGVCNETLRLYPTVPLTVRVANKDTTIGSVYIPKDQRIFIVPWAINRSTEFWGPSANEFIPDRWIDKGTLHPNNTGGASSNYCNLTFLHGPRSCIGQGFAKAELRTLVVHLIRAFDIQLADPNGKLPKPAGVITSKPGGGMKLRLTKINGLTSRR